MQRPSSLESRLPHFRTLLELSFFLRNWFFLTVNSDPKSDLATP
jgi:hypothetical protein